MSLTTAIAQCYTHAIIYICRKEAVMIAKTSFTVKSSETSHRPVISSTEVCLSRSNLLHLECLVFKEERDVLPMGMSSWRNKTL